MKLRIIRYMLYWLLLPAAAACTKEQFSTESPLLPEAEYGEFKLSFALQFPEPQSAISRSFAENPDYDNLDLYCIVFQDNGQPSANYLAEVKKALHHPDEAYTDSNGRYLIPFEVNLSATDEDAIIHFIAIDNSIPYDKNPMQHIEYGPENIVIPRLTTTEGHDAYWQRIALGCPIMNANREQIETMVSRFSPVPMIRNFAKISVTLSDELQNKTTDDGKPFFELEGFCVVNAIDRGSIAPYNETIGFPSFVQTSSVTNDGKTVNFYTPYSYEEITSGLKHSQGNPTSERIPGYPYIGMRPNGWKIINNTVPNESDFTPEAKYLYERPFSEANHTYVIVSGKYNGNVSTQGSGKTTYYKLDIGRNDSRGLFEFCHLLRNFNYKIIITNVEADGYSTPQDAAIGQIYNNNLSAAVETQHLLNISDGHDMMYVNFTSYVIVKPGTINLQYRYFNLGDNTLDNDNQEIGVVVWNDPKDGCVAGDVIASAVRDDDLVEDDIMQGTTPVHRKWENIQITPKTPTPEMKVQTVTLYKPFGLSRTITLYLCTPWELKNVNTYSGRFDGREDRPTTTPGIVSDKGGQELTIFFELPEHLPKAMFPLEFVIESNRQNIENDKNGTIVVKSAPSMFEDVTDYRIQYTKTVTWEEYDPDNKSDDPNSTSDNYDSEGNYLGNIVRCRFLTITDLNADDISQKETTVLIYNPYFEMSSTKFTRATIQ